MVVTIYLWETRMDLKAQCGIYCFIRYLIPQINILIHPYQPVAESIYYYINRKYCSKAVFSRIIMNNQLMQE